MPAPTYVCSNRVGVAFSQTKTAAKGIQLM